MFSIDNFSQNFLPLHSFHMCLLLRSSEESVIVSLCHSVYVRFLWQVFFETANNTLRITSTFLIHNNIFVTNV